MFFLIPAFLIAGCRGGAVVFAPVPTAPLVSLVQYNHPSGTFTLALPGDWAIFERHTTTLSSASFAPSGEHTPLLYLSAVRLPVAPVDSAAFTALLDSYQQQIRPDVARYREESREAMGDGSWRITGLRQITGGTTQQLNTFFQLQDDILSVSEIVLHKNYLPELEQIINTFRLNETSTLEVSNASTLAFATSGRLEALNVHTWTTEVGVFFITGEVINYSDQVLNEIPVKVVLFTEDGRTITEASDMVMGYAVQPGAFAPFSLRFGEGQPALTNRFVLSFGNSQWQPDTAMTLYGGDVLAWNDNSLVTSDGRLMINGEITNLSIDTYVYLPRVTVTVFDAFQRVIAAGFTDLEDVELTPGEVAPYELVLPELGGIPSRYIVNVQGQS